ncbi:MAG: SCP2 sterol-binding domain-containing protein [Actinomycetota bacterium]
METDSVEFGTVAVYQAMADRLNEDPEWLEVGRNITYSMSYVYGPPVDKTFFVRFESGKVTDVRELPSPDAEAADFVISGPADVWRGVVRGEVNPTTAMAKGQLKVEGKMTTLLRHMNAFSRIINVLKELNIK